MTTACLDRRVSCWPWVVVALWLTGSALGFWYFQLRDQRPFERARLTVFDAQARAAAAERWFREDVRGVAAFGQSSVTVVHVYAAGCACNRFTGPHLAKIVARYRPRGVRFIAASRLPAVSGHQAGDLPQLPIPAGSGLDWLDSTPAALVYSASGQLVYYGPYSSAAWCGSGGGLVERVLDRVLAGQTPALQPFYSNGCFCPGRNKVTNG